MQPTEHKHNYIFCSLADAYSMTHYAIFNVSEKTSITYSSKTCSLLPEVVVVV